MTLHMYVCMGVCFACLTTWFVFTQFACLFSPMLFLPSLYFLKYYHEPEIKMVGKNILLAKR